MIGALGTSANPLKLIEISALIWQGSSICHPTPKLFSVTSATSSRPFRLSLDASDEPSLEAHQTDTWSLCGNPLWHFPKTGLREMTQQKSSLWLEPHLLVDFDINKSS